MAVRYSNTQVALQLQDIHACNKSIQLCICMAHACHAIACLSLLKTVCSSRKKCSSAVEFRQ